MRAVEYMILRTPERCQRDAIVQEVADALHGNDGETTIEAILASRCVSHDTVVREFGGTDALVVAVVRRIAESLLEPLSDDPTEASFKRQLVEFSRRAMDEYAGSRLKNLYRLAIADASRDAGMKGEVYRNGPGLLQRELARFFRSARMAGVSLHADSHRLANYFVALLRTHWDLSDMSGSQNRRSAQGDIGWLVETFFRGLQAEADRA